MFFYADQLREEKNLKIVANVNKFFWGQNKRKFLELAQFEFYIGDGERRYAKKNAI